MALSAVTLAFIAGLQRLPSRQAAALVLRDVLGFATHEAASMLGTSQTAVKGTLQRARAALDKHRDPATRGHRGPGRPPNGAIARRFADAYIAADINAVVALLTDDTWLSMPPAPHQYHGHRRRPVVPASQLRLPRRPPRVPGAHRRQHPARPGQLPQRSCPAGRHPGRTIRTHHGRPEDPGHHRFHLDELYPRFGLAGSLPGPAAQPQLPLAADR